MTSAALLTPDWPAPPGVRAVTSLRIGGVSRGPYAGFNLGAHVGDDAPAVAANRARLISLAGLPAEPVWLRQVHGTRVIDLDGGTPGDGEADAAVTSVPGVVCAVLTADCLPVLLTDTDGRRVAAAHAGWRGLASGVLEAVVAAFAASPGELLAWLGPCFGPAGFEVGPEVRAALLSTDPGAGGAFEAGRGDRWHADLPALATRRLQRAGLNRIYRSGLCTWADPARFFSHRRDGLCGRMATVLWREQAASGR